MTSNSSDSKPRILIADDEETIRRLVEYNLKRAGYEPVMAMNGKEALALAGDDLTCALVDLKMPELDGMGVLKYFKKHHPQVPVLIMSAVGQVKDAVAAMKQGAFEYITKPFDLDELLALTNSACQFGDALRENRELRDTVSESSAEQEFFGQSEFAQKLQQTVAKVAPLDATVLITGESGVGKGLLARLLHRASKRAAQPFILASCPTLPRELLESEMFGHERGAFTGAHQRRIGRLEMAESGTLFLDEIGELPLMLQPKLLNVLQDRQFQRVGGAKLINANVRIIAATNVDLKEKVEAKEFREDLYYRLNVIHIRVPALRERRMDIPILSQQVLARIAQARGTPPLEISAAAAEILSNYSWPGNVRELENMLERTAAFCPGPIIQAADLPEELVRTQARQHSQGEAATPRVSIGGMLLEDVEKLAIRETLALCSGNKAAAARSLGITEKSIYNKMARLGLKQN